MVFNTRSSKSQEKLVTKTKNALQTVVLKTDTIPKYLKGQKFKDKHKGHLKEYSP